MRALDQIRGVIEAVKNRLSASDVKQFAAELRALHKERRSVRQKASDEHPWMRSWRTQAALEYFGQAVQPVTAPELAHHLECSTDTAANVIKRLVKRGQVERGEPGQYRVVQTVA